MYYIDELFYHYYIGREDQSVNEQVMIERIDQQLKVNKLMIRPQWQDKRGVNKNCRRYMLSYLDIIMTVSSMLLLKIWHRREFKKKKQELWAYLKAADAGLYLQIRHGLLGRACNLPGKERTQNVSGSLSNHAEVLWF